MLDPATGDLSARTEALLYAADKAQHVAEVVRPALAAGSVVVCDRYVDSMLAYQGAGRVLALAELEPVARWATEDLRPHLTVVLDLDPDQAVGTKVDKDRLEAAGDDLHRRARDFFLALAAADPDHYLVLPARLPIAEIAGRIRDRVRPLLPTPALADALLRTLTQGVATAASVTGGVRQREGGRPPAPAPSPYGIRWPVSAAAGRLGP